MFRPASRVLLRAPAVTTVRGPASRRLISTGPDNASKSRSWKNTVMRLGLAGGVIYYFNTSSAFADKQSFSFRPIPQPNTVDDSALPTLDSIKPKIRQQREAEAAQKQPPKQESSHPDAQSAPVESTPDTAALNDAQSLEEEAGQEAAFNPETGEINWDCPCLGGMAHGPCGEDFKAAFSCFVYSTEEPKGIDCIEKFKGMQDCFRQYPDVYGAELEDDEQADAAAPAEGVEAAAPESAPELEQETKTEN
ncbi:Oxidoreductase [Aspergillus nanangensis]|uniref:Mitochondrial intermembrane space import and assembly protein 40 n=1 Tax=Aspergillus nanangensis TaxID=2582783 RepID=A0AAD4CYD1_ASPNN|nr:Oxidoreductase [Aspergillus nanangensis]